MALITPVTICTVLVSVCNYLGCYENLIILAQLLLNTNYETYKYGCGKFGGTIM